VASLRQNTFPRAEILKHRDFLRLQKQGKATRNPYVTAVFAPGIQDVTRLGITAGKHVGKAWQRNRIKRLIREFFRLNRHLLGRNWDINISVKKEATVLASSRLFSECKTVFLKVSEHALNGL